MKTLDHVEDQSTESVPVGETDPLLPLVVGRATTAQSSWALGVVVGELVAMAGDGLTPLIVYPGQSGSAAVAARSIVDLHGVHVGKPVLLVFEGGDPGKPIVLGVVRAAETWPLGHKPGQVDVDADGSRLTVNAKEELVLRCGKASITLTKEGKVLIHGTYLSSRSSGVNRIKGGSVHVN